MSALRRSAFAAFATTLRSTAAAYGYTLTIATTSLTVSSVAGRPGEGDLFLFAAGGIAAFAAMEAILLATRAQPGGAPEHAFPFAGALNFASVAGGLGAATGMAHAVGGDVAWLVAPLVATVAYMVLVAVQVTAVDAARRRQRPDGD